MGLVGINLTELPSGWTAGCELDRVVPLTVRSGDLGDFFEGLFSSVANGLTEEFIKRCDGHDDVNDPNLGKVIHLSMLKAFFNANLSEALRSSSTSPPSPSFRAQESITRRNSWTGTGCALIMASDFEIRVATGWRQYPTSGINDLRINQNCSVISMC
jgi:hypothetical protein